MSFQYIGNLFLEVIELKRRKESERPQMESHHRWNRLLKEQRRVYQRSVASETDNEIDLVRQVIPAVPTIDGKRQLIQMRQVTNFKETEPT